METTLRPLTVSEILDRTAQLYRSNFLLFAGISSVYAGVLLVLSLLQIALQEILRLAHMTQQFQWLAWGASGVTLLLAFIFAGAAVAANNRAVAWVHLGEHATIRGAYAGILPRLGRYLWLMTIAAFVVWLPMVILCVGYFSLLLFYVGSKGLQGQAVVAPDNHSMIIVGVVSIVFVLLMIPALVYTVLMGLRYSLAVPASISAKARAAGSFSSACSPLSFRSDSCSSPRCFSSSSASSITVSSPPQSAPCSKLWPSSPIRS